MLAGRALVSDVPTLLKHLVEDGEAPGPVAVTLVAPADLSIAPHWQNRQATGGNGMSPTRAGVPTLSGACRARALVSDVPTLLDHLVGDGENDSGFGQNDL